jgi:uncharacterized protein RhaS with RHS repeats
VKKSQYTLDALGNRTDVTWGGNTESYTLDNLNRVTDIDFISGNGVPEPIPSSEAEYPKR